MQDFFTDLWMKYANKVLNYHHIMLKFITNLQIQYHMLPTSIINMHLVVLEIICSKGFQTFVDKLCKSGT